ncbi:MAG: hypothetical protein JWM02_2451 [Frankiales bacterium]|nr:hypothetical protein [Frankiales bacterium]
MSASPHEPAPSSSFAPPPFPDGLVLAPFRGLRYDPAVDLASVTSPPYDVIDAAGVAALEQASDVNVVRLILPRDEASEGDRYLRAASTLARWRSAGVLRPDPEPALYVYEQSSQGHAQRGLLGALALSPPEDGIVLPHENTMSGTVSDRLALYTAVGADLEPIFLLYGGGGAASEAVAGVSSRVPLLDVTLADGLRHRLWALTNPAQLSAIAEDLHGRTAVIADGHHRYATYLQRQAAAHAAGQGPGPWDTGLTFLVDSTAFGPEVHPIHRVIPDIEAFELARRAEGAMRIHDLDGDDLDAGLHALGAAGSTGPAFLLVSGDGGTLRLLTDPHADRLARALPSDRSAAWRRLDVSVLHHYLVADVWGLVDDVDTVRYEHDVDAALATASASGGTAVLLNPTPVDAVTAVASGGERMPRKSTLFTPKPRTGLVIRDHRDA